MNNWGGDKIIDYRSESDIKNGDVNFLQGGKFPYREIWADHFTDELMKELTDKLKMLSDIEKIEYGKSICFVSGGDFELEFRSLIPKENTVESDKRAIQEEKNKEEIKIDYEKINWTSNDYYNSWKRLKQYMKSEMKKDLKGRLFFLAHDFDKIEGKPQLIEQTRQLIPLVTKLWKKDNKTQEEFYNYKLIDETIDKRSDGSTNDLLNIPLWVYRIINNASDEYIIFSEKKLGLEYSVFNGMEMQIAQFAELSKNLKLRGTARVFFVKEYHSSIIKMPKEECVALTKKLNKDIGLTQDKFLEFIYAHEDGKVYRHCKEYELVRFAQLFSGKWNGYPLHIINMGPPGKGKTQEVEALDFKFREDAGILEAGNSTTKALSPSFKEKPAEPGYLLRCQRLGLVDELMKMVKKSMENSRSDHRSLGGLNELNAILEHKTRNIGSGNNNFMVINPSSKIIFATNPIEGKNFLHEHLGIVDSSMISRNLVLCYDKKESKFISNNIPYKYKLLNKIKKDHTSNNLLYSICAEGNEKLPFEFENQDIFISLYDSLNDFVCEIDEEKMLKMGKGVLSQANSELREIYEKRILHHGILLLDGLVKFRCLFKDFDDSFEVKEEDYNEVEKLLFHVVLSWDEPIGINRSSY